MKAIVLALALVMVAGCGKHGPKVYTDASAVVQIARSWNAYALRHARTHRRFIPLYHRIPTQWLAWLADGRPKEDGS